MFQFSQQNIHWCFQRRKYAFSYVSDTSYFLRLHYTHSIVSVSLRKCSISGLYGSGLFNFRSYVNLPTLFACFLGFDVPTSSFIFIENVFIILVHIVLCLCFIKEMLNFSMCTILYTCFSSDLSI